MQSLTRRVSPARTGLHGYTCPPVTWGPTVRLTETPFQTTHPQVIASEPNIFGMLWESGRTYDFETKQWGGRARLLFRRSTDGGETWGDEQQISDRAGATHALAFQCI